MNYLDIISLGEAKNHLRVDDDLTADDAAISRMIQSALVYIESWTNLLLIDRAKTYKLVDGFVRVFDYPINSITSPDEDDMTIEVRNLHTSYSYGIETTDLVLNVGYSDLDDIPTGLIDVGLELIDLFYYSKETGKNTSDISPMSIDILNRHKRFFL